MFAELFVQTLALTIPGYFIRQVWLASRGRAVGGLTCYAAAWSAVFASDGAAQLLNEQANKI